MCLLKLIFDNEYNKQNKTRRKCVCACVYTKVIFQGSQQFGYHTILIKRQPKTRKLQRFFRRLNFFGFIYLFYAVQWTFKSVTFKICTRVAFRANLYQYKCVCVCRYYFICSKSSYLLRFGFDIHAVADSCVYRICVAQIWGSNNYHYGFYFRGGENHILCNK